MALFTPEELEELRRADAELDEEFVQTQDEIEESRKRDREVRIDRLDSRSRKIAENQRAYREANREKIAENKRAYYEANREKIADNGSTYVQEVASRYPLEADYASILLGDSGLSE